AKGKNLKNRVWLPVHVIGWRDSCVLRSEKLSPAQVFPHIYLRRKGQEMARVTVEDCIDKVENRFDLVLLASHRARQISQGAPITVDRDNDKNPVVALREIADETLSPGDLKE